MQNKCLKSRNNEYNISSQSVSKEYSSLCNDALYKFWDVLRMVTHIRVHQKNKIPGTYF